MKRIELIIESIILASRWLLVIFYLGLALALAVYALSFMHKLFDFSVKITSLTDTDTILKMLGLIDATLIGSLVVMVIISGYENFVSRFEEGEKEVHWLGTIDAGSLKVKVASTIVAISSIHLLQIFLNATHYDGSQLMWYTLLHLTFVLSAIFLAYIDWFTGKKKNKKRD